MAGDEKAGAEDKRNNETQGDDEGGGDSPANGTTGEPPASTEGGGGEGHSIAKLEVVRGLQSVATRIADDVYESVQADTSVRVMVVDTLGLTERGLSRLEIHLRLDEFKSSFADLTEFLDKAFPPPGGEVRLFGADAGKDADQKAVEAAGAVTGVAIGTAALDLFKATVAAGKDFVGLVQASYALTSHVVSLPDTSLALAVVGELVERGAANVHYAGFAAATGTITFEKYEEAAKARNLLRTAYVRAALSLEEQGAPPPEKGTPEKGTPEQGEPALLLAVASSLLESFGVFSNALLAVPAGSSASLLASAAVQEFVAPSKAKTGSTLFLYVKPTMQGGETVKGSGLLSGGRTTVYGFAQATYLLARDDGRVQRSGAVTAASASRLEEEGLITAKAPPVASSGSASSTPDAKGGVSLLATASGLLLAIGGLAMIAGVLATWVTALTDEQWIGLYFGWVGYALLAVAVAVAVSGVFLAIASTERRWLVGIGDATRLGFIVSLAALVLSIAVAAAIGDGIRSLGFSGSLVIGWGLGTVIAGASLAVVGAFLARRL